MAVGATLFGTSVAAYAATPTVTFTGTPMLGIGAVSCPSTPSRGSVEITAGQAVTFINHTGKNASLWIGDQSQPVTDRAAATVHFDKQASLLVEMVPICPLDSANHASTVLTVDKKPATTAATTHSAATTQPVQAAGISQQTNVTASGGGAVISGGPVPSGVSTVAAGAPVVITNNRDLINMIALLAAILTGAAVCSALLLWRRLPRRGARTSGGGGGGLTLVGGKDRSVPENQAAQIWEMARKVGYREGYGKRRSRS